METLSLTAWIKTDRAEPRVKDETSGKLTGNFRKKRQKSVLKELLIRQSRAEEETTFLRISQSPEGYKVRS